MTYRQSQIDPCQGTTGFVFDLFHFGFVVVFLLLVFLWVFWVVFFLGGGFIVAIGVGFVLFFLLFFVYFLFIFSWKGSKKILVTE